MAEKAEIFTPSARNWRSFLALVALQTQNAFNDNAVRFILLPLGTALAAELGGISRYFQHILGACLVVPYILFSPLCGWMADRFSKKSIINAALLMQTGVFLTIMAAVHLRLIWIATAGFFFLALQSTLLSPAKNGIIKELVGTARLNFANGWMEMTLIVAILGGMFVGGWAFDHGYMGRPPTADHAWSAAAAPLWLLTGATLLALSFGTGVEKVPPCKPDERFHPRFLWGHFVELKRLFSTRAMRLSAIGVTYFWILGAMAQLVIVQVAKEATGGQGGMGSATSIMTACASGGIAIGSVIAALVGRKRTELGLVPAGGILMSLACAALAFTPVGGSAFHIGLVAVGACSALFYVPLFAFLQELAPEAERGRLIAASNLLNNLGMVFATLVQALLMKSGLGAGAQFGIMGVASIFVAFITLRLLPDRFFRMILLPIARRLWKVKAAGMENVPATGGALMVCNHISYVDAFVLSAACPRPIRFLIFEGYYNLWWARWFLNIFGAVPIAKGKAHGAIKAAAAAIADGHLVCIFPEGKLTTDGKMNSFLGGLELILRLSPAPLVPAAIRGLWGSFFSHAGGAPFTWSRTERAAPASIIFGAVLPADTSAAQAETAVRKLVGS
jgi:acyl-[acyl-carrier-protein]-phospholipid O-acyltransferase/long-chain-fatty-acid--[acyl-carrier-protein] ligase